jgi:hypothetical protein
MEQSCGPLAVEFFPGKHCDFSTYLAKRAGAQSGACADVQFPDYGKVLWSPDNRNASKKALRFQHLSCQKSEISVWRMRRGAIFLIMEQRYGPLTVNIFQESTAVSALILPRERELSLEHAQRCSFLINEQCCGPLAVENIPGKNCDYSISLANSARAQSEHAQRCSFLIMEQIWSPGSRNDSRKTMRFQHLSCQECES